LDRCRWFPRQRFSPLLRTLLARNIHLLRALFVWRPTYAAFMYLNLSNMLAAALLIAGDEQMHSGGLAPLVVIEARVNCPRAAALPAASVSGPIGSRFSMGRHQIFNDIWPI
jgi:hypothetical protein